MSKRSISNFSNESSSGRANLTPLNNLSNSGNNPNRRNDKLASGSQVRNNSAAISQRYEQIDNLYDKLLEDEDKILLQAKKKEAKLKRKLKQEQR